MTAEPVSPTASTPLGDYLRHEWLPRKGPAYASGSRRHRDWAVATLCDSRLVDRPIGELTTLEIERYFAERAGTPFPQRGQLPARGSLKALFATLNACLGEAARYGIIPDNPCARVRLPPDRSEAQSVWTAGQVQQFLDGTAHSRLHTLWRLLFATGMRRGEALGLTWRSLDLDRGRVHITRAMLADSRRGHVLYGPPKNRTSMRTIRIDAGTCEALRAWKAQRLEESGGDLAEELAVFAYDDGSEFLPATVSDTFRRHVRLSGLPPLPLHGIRHTHLSHLLAAGEPVPNVAARAGHSTAALTLRTYAHVIPGDDERTIARTARLFGR
ncbi:MAG: site-specific integrase [bacterium]